MALLVALSLIVLPIIIHPIGVTTLKVVGPLEVSQPIMQSSDTAGFGRAYLNVTNHDSVTLSYVVILQFQDDQGYVTQVVYSEPIIVEPSEEMKTIIEYSQESGKRLIDVFVWTELQYPSPVARYVFINNDEAGTFRSIPVTGDEIVALSRMLANCEDADELCDAAAYAELQEHYRDCMDYREFGVGGELSPFCSDQRLDKYGKSSLFYPGPPNWKTFTVEAREQSYAIQYWITGGRVVDMILDVETSSFTIYVSSTADGKLTIRLPRDLIDAREGEEDTDFAVFVDEETVDVNEIESTSTMRTLAIDFDSGTEIIEIVRTWY